MYLLRLTIKIKPIIQLYTNKHTPTMNFYSTQQKPFRLWYNLNKKTERKLHSSLMENTPDKFSSILNNRTLHDITNLFDQYKRTPSETPITTLTHTHVYEVALGGSVHETGIRWDVHTFPLVGHTQNL